MWFGYITSPQVVSLLILIRYYLTKVMWYVRKEQLNVSFCCYLYRSLIPLATSDRRIKVQELQPTDVGRIGTLCSAPGYTYIGITSLRCGENFSSARLPSETKYPSIAWREGYRSIYMRCTIHVLYRCMRISPSSYSALNAWRSRTCLCLFCKVLCHLGSLLCQVDCILYHTVSYLSRV